MVRLNSCANPGLDAGRVGQKPHHDDKRFDPAITASLPDNPIASPHRVSRDPFANPAERGSACFDGLAHAGNLVTAEVVGDEDVARRESWRELFFHIGEDQLAVDGTVEQARRNDAVVLSGSAVA